MKHTSWKITPLSRKPLICNNNKIKYLSPLNDNIIKKAWLDKIPIILKTYILDKFPNCIIPNREHPYETFLNEYVNYYDFTRFAHIIPNNHIITLSSKEVNNMLVLCLLFQKGDFVGRLFSEEHIHLINPELLEKIENYLDNENTGVFVKTSFKSGKHGIKLFPSFTTLDVMNNLIHSNDVLLSLMCRENISLIFRKWNYNIDKTNEFRLFIEDSELTNISQTYPSIHMNISKENADKYLTLMIDFWTKISPKINELAMDYTIDVSVHNDDVYIIEINSGGKWSSSASCLFDYETMKPYEFLYVM